MAVENIYLWLIEPTDRRKICARLSSKVIDPIIEIPRSVVSIVEQSDSLLADSVEQPLTLTDAS
jgi:hypothetical protein